MIKLTYKEEFIYFNPLSIKVVRPHIYTENDKVFNKTYIECIDSTSYVIDESIDKVVKLINKALKVK